MKIPGSPHRHYLSGSDWVAQATDWIHRDAGALFSGSQIVMELEGPPDGDTLTKAIAAFCSEFPFLNGRVRRDWNLAPFWQPATKTKRKPPRVQCHQLAYPDELDPLLINLANAPLGETYDYVAFDLIGIDHGPAYLIFRFDHRLFDARGAEMFLNRLTEFANGNLKAKNAANGIQLVAPAGLDRWKEKFNSGKQTVRRLRELESLQIMPPPPFRTSPLRFSLRTLSEDESRIFTENVNRKAGYLMVATYVLFHTGRVLNELWKDRITSGDRFLASTSIDLRSTDSDQVQLFLNHYALMYFQLSAAPEVKEDTELRQIRDQLFDQTKRGLPSHFKNAWVLMRILPIPIYGRIVRRMTRNLPLTLNLAFLGLNDFKQETLLNQPVRNLFHMPRIPPLLGAGLYLRPFGNRFNLCLTYYEGYFGDVGGDRVLDLICEHCLATDEKCAPL